MKGVALFAVLSSSIFLSNEGRSPHRPIDPELPIINAHWHTCPDTSHTLRNSHILDRIFYQYDEPFLMERKLPAELITLRYNPEQTVCGAHLSKLINELLEEIRSVLHGKKLSAFKNFDILKIRDVDFKDMTGLYVLKFKDYPFIVKLFIETPEGFAQPTEKGFEPTVFFYMGGGMGRHLAGFTRIKNLEAIKTIIADNPEWNAKLAFPRKWFWIPDNPTWIEVHGKNIGKQRNAYMRIPGTYAIICDQIIWDRPFKLTQKEDKKTIISLANFLEQRLDLHINNFGIEKDSDKITPIDFEYFPAVVGLSKGERRCSGYFEWYANLSMKCLKDLFFRNKAERKLLQSLAYND